MKSKIYYAAMLVCYTLQFIDDMNHEWRKGIVDAIVQGIQAAKREDT